MNGRAGMHKEEIKAAIRMKGVSVTGLALKHGYCRSAVSMTLQQPWPAVEKLIADLLEMPPHEIWPDRYPQQTRQHHNDNSVLEDNTPISGGEVQLGTAA